MSDYFGRLLGRTFEKPAITPRVRARFEPQGDGEPEVDVERASIERESADAEGAGDIAAAPPQEPDAAQAATLEPSPLEVHKREPQATGAPSPRTMTKRETLVVRERIAPPPANERALPLENDSEPALALPAPKITPRSRTTRTPPPPRLDQQRAPAPASPARALAPRINEPQIIERSTIKVTIGHVELRAPSSEEKRPEKSKEQQTMMLTLEDYMLDRKEGRR